MADLQEQLHREHDALKRQAHVAVNYFALEGGTRSLYRAPHLREMGRQTGQIPENSAKNDQSPGNATWTDRLRELGQPSPARRGLRGPVPTAFLYLLLLANPANHWASACRRSTEVLIFQQRCFRSDIKKTIINMRRVQLQDVSGKPYFTSFRKCYE